MLLPSSDAAPKTGFTHTGLLHAGSGYWAAEEPLPVRALADHAVVPVGNSLFILGGQFVDNQVGASHQGQLWLPPWAARRLCRKFRCV